MYKEGLSSQGSVIGTNSIFFEEIDSTNDEAKRLLSKSNPTEGTVIYCNRQWLGRGQIDSQWQSDVGKNIILSLIVYPHFLNIEKNFDLNIWVSTAIVDALQLLCDDVKIKWPNDIFIGEKKIGGILIENSIRGAQLNSSVIGIGLNVNQTDFVGLPNATSLAVVTGKENNLMTLSSRILESLDRMYQSMRYGFSFKDQYLTFLLGYGQQRWFRDRRNDVTFQGMIQGIDNQGRLQVFSQDGISSFWMKEIEFLFNTDDQ